MAQHLHAGAAAAAADAAQPHRSGWEGAAAPESAIDVSNGCCHGPSASERMQDVAMLREAIKCAEFLTRRQDGVPDGSFLAYLYVLEDT